MTKGKFVCLCQEYPISLTFEEAKELANNAIQEELDLFELYDALYKVNDFIKASRVQLSALKDIDHTYE